MVPPTVSPSVPCRREYETREVDSSALAQSIAEEIGAAMAWDDRLVLHLTMALYEALVNAVDHGNLGLSSALIPDDPLLPGDPFADYFRLREARLADPLYADRRVTIEYTCTETSVCISVTDQGEGFDVEHLPDPGTPENLCKPYGRGIQLIRTLMDEVRFSNHGQTIIFVKYSPKKG